MRATGIAGGVELRDENRPDDPEKAVWTADPKTSGYRQGLLEDGDIASLGAEGADLTVKMVVAVG